jgi:hypothetical protein
MASTRAGPLKGGVAPGPFCLGNGHGVHTPVPTCHKHAGASLWSCPDAHDPP